MTEPIKIDYAPPAMRRRHSVFIMLVISFAMAFAFAITFVVVMTLTLPKTDGAYGQMPFHDPLVFPVMSMGASFAGLLAFPFFYFACRSRPLGRSVAVIAGITLAELVIVTPIHSGAGLFGSFAAFAAGLVVARTMTE